MFSGLTLDETVDWLAIEAAIDWCGTHGVKLEVPSGVYMCNRPVWIGDDSTITESETDKDNRVYGFTMAGQTSNSREQSDGGVANIRLTEIALHRYCLSMNSVPSLGSKYQLWFNFRGLQYQTGAIDWDASFAEIETAVETALAPDYTIALEVTSDALALTNENMYFRLESDGVTLTEEFEGEVEVRDDDGLNPPVNYVRCIPDSGVVSFRRSAGVHYRLENLTLKGNDINENFDRYACFGVLFPTTQFFGHQLERIEVSFVDTAIGILQGTGANGEQTRVSRVFGNQLRRGYYSNAPQAFAQEFDGWNLVLDADGIYADFADMAAPGVGVNFTNCHGTFNQQEEDELHGTLVRIRRGTGIVQFNGGRVEHMSTLFDYDATDPDGSNCNMDMIVRAVEFEGVRGGTYIEDAVEHERYFVYGWDSGSEFGSNYGLTVTDCKFQGKSGASLDPSTADLVLEAEKPDDLRGVFERCRFIGVRAIKMQGAKADFVRCYRNDFKDVGSTDTELPMRQFSQDTGAPGTRTQSLRTGWQDTPWIQTGPRVNILKNSDLELQTPGTNVACDAADWNCYQLSTPGGMNLAAFGKWGQGGVSEIGDVSPGPESFGVGLYDDSYLTSDMDYVTLSSTDPLVVTYQCLCRVTGQLVFKLVNSGDDLLVYDQVTVGTPGGTAPASPALVTLRIQLARNDGDSPRLRIENGSGSDAVLQVVWQHAWTGGGGGAFTLEDGLRNFAHTRTPGGEEVTNTYIWGVNATSVKASSRFQLPLKEQGFGWQAAEPTGMDMNDGEVYFDVDQIALLMRADDQWYMFQQPERFEHITAVTSYTWSPGSPRNVVSDKTTSGSVTVTLTTTNVVDGTLVRVFRRYTGSGTTVAVTVSASGKSYLISQDRMCEFIYDGAISAWLCTQFNVQFQ